MIKIKQLMDALPVLAKKGPREIEHYNDVFQANLKRYGFISILILASLLHPYLLGYPIYSFCLEGILLLSSMAVCDMNEVINLKKLPFRLLYKWAARGIPLSILWLPRALSEPSSDDLRFYIYEAEIDACLKVLLTHNEPKRKLLEALKLEPNASDEKINSQIDVLLQKIDPNNHSTETPEIINLYVTKMQEFDTLVQNYRRVPSKTPATQNAGIEKDSNAKKEKNRDSFIIEDGEMKKKRYEDTVQNNLLMTMLHYCFIYGARSAKDAGFRHLAQQGINFMSLGLAAKWKVYTSIFCSSYLKLLPYMGIVMGVFQALNTNKFSDLNLRRDSGLAKVIRCGVDVMGMLLIPCIIGILPIPIIQTHFIVNWVFQGVTLYGLVTGLDNIVAPLVAKVDIALRKLIGIPHSIVDRIIQEYDPPFSPDVPQDVRLQSETKLEVTPT